MKYLIVKNNLTNEEIIGRKDYIYNLFQIYTFKDNINSTLDTTLLKSVPENAINLFMIVGHDRSTDEYIKNHYKEIVEDNIVIISCNTSKFKNLNLLKNKNVYLPKNGKIIDFYDGKNYGFDFYITDDEIMLYRNKNKNLEKMLNDTFERR